MFLPYFDTSIYSFLKDFRSPLNSSIHCSTFYLKEGNVVLSLHNSTGREIEIDRLGNTFYFPQYNWKERINGFGCTGKYPLPPREWHFVAFSFDASTGKGIVVVDEKVWWCFFIFINSKMFIHLYRSPISLPLAPSFSTLPTIFTDWPSEETGIHNRRETLRGQCLACRYILI